MKRSLFIIIALLGICIGRVEAQQYHAHTGYTWDNWHDNQWAYQYDGGWVYAYPKYGNPNDFYFRFKKSDLGIHELNRKEWKALKSKSNSEGWSITTQFAELKRCQFEYYITDRFPTIEDALKNDSWPSAKYYHKMYDAGKKPIVLKSESVQVLVYYSDDDEVRQLCFQIHGYAFSITVHWDYSGYNMTYTY